MSLAIFSVRHDGQKGGTACWDVYRGHVLRHLGQIKGISSTVFHLFPTTCSIRYQTKSQWTKTHRTISKWTKSKEDKNPGGQYPSETNTKGDKSPGGQPPTGTKTHGGQYPRVQNPRGTKSQDLCICICIRDPGACVYCRGFAELKA